MATADKRRNNIKRIQIGREWLEWEAEVRTSIVAAFKELLCDRRGWRASLEGLNFCRLAESKFGWLEMPFIEEEVFP